MTLSLDQVGGILGDPTTEVFQRMYARFPELQRFRVDGDDWEHFMVQEVLTHLMHLCENPEEGLATVGIMSAHHDLIGVSTQTFSGFYDTLFDVFTPHFHGPHKTKMLQLWQDCLKRIALEIRGVTESPRQVAH